MEGARVLPLFVLLTIACCLVKANNETLPELKKSKGNDRSASKNTKNEKLLELLVEEGKPGWFKKFKKLSKEMAEELENENPEKNNKQYNNQSITEFQDAAPKDKLIKAVRTKLTAFSGPLSSRATDSLTKLEKKWYHLSDDSKQGALDTLGVISSNIEVFGNAGEDPVGAIRGAIDIVASISSNFGPMGQLASTALGFVSALLGLFGKGPKPKPLGEIVREQINEALEEYRDEELTRKADGLLTAFRHTKAYLDGAAESGKPFGKDERIVVAKEVERTQGVAFMGELAYAVRKMFKNNKPSDARKAIRYCEMYAQLAVIRDIILTQYIAMIPKTWQGHLNGVIRDRALMRRVAKTLLETLYTVDYDSKIMPYFDPDVSIITDTYSTKMLNLGKYDRSMAGQYCLITQGKTYLENLDWQSKPKEFKPSGNPYTTTVKPNNDNCYWKLVPHGRDTYSIINKYKCKEKHTYCDRMLSWSKVGNTAYVDIDSDDPVLWEIWGHTWKYIRNKSGCGKTKSKWCNYHLRMKTRTVMSFNGSWRLVKKIKKIVGQLAPSDGKYYWII